MKATDLIFNQHRDVDHLFDQLERVEGSDKKVIREELAKSIVAHSVIEKEIFYPAIREAMVDQIDEAYEEHGLVEFALYRLLSTRLEDESFKAKCEVLKEVFTHHSHEEEREILKRAESILNDTQLDTLGERMEERFEEVQLKGYERFLLQAIAEAMPKTARRATTKAKTRRAPAKKRVAAKAKRATPATRGAKRGTAKRGTAKRGTTKRVTTKRGTAKPGTAKRGSTGTRKTATTKRSGGRTRSSRSE